MGRAAIVAAFDEIIAVGGCVSVEIRQVVAGGDFVLTERVDLLEVGGRSVALRVAGVFELGGRQIAAGRDYFDLAEFPSHLASGSLPPPGYPDCSAVPLPHAVRTELWL